jgi:hypothetical protein
MPVSEIKTGACRMRWLTRKQGTSAQIGKPFPLGEKKLPRLDVPRRFRQLNPESAVTKIIHVNPAEVIWREKRPVDLKRRAQYFVRMVLDGRPVPPILVYAVPGGKYKCFDGHARLAAFRILGIKSVPAILKKDHSGISYKESRAIREGLMA